MKRLHTRAPDNGAFLFGNTNSICCAICLHLGYIWDIIRHILTYALGVSMALAIIEQQAEPPIQLPLPDPDTLPAWVHAALDKWDTSNATYIGLRVLRENYSALRKPHALERIENMAFAHLRHLATLWQFANFRTYVTSFELQILEAETEALKMPFALKRYTYQTMCRDGNGDVYWIDEEQWEHDRKWIVGFIQRRLGRYGAIMGEHQIQNMLNKIDAIYEVCESLEIEVQVYESHTQPLRKELQRAS